MLWRIAEVYCFRLNFIILKWGYSSDSLRFAPGPFRKPRQSTLGTVFEVRTSRSLSSERTSQRTSRSLSSERTSRSLSLERTSRSLSRYFESKLSRAHTIHCRKDTGAQKYCAVLDIQHTERIVLLAIFLDR